MVQVNCTHCEGAFPLDGEAAWTGRACPWCKEVLSVFAFPALNRKHHVRSGGIIVPGEGQASCFFHAHKSATVPCDSCGRFLCGLCDLEFRKGHYCATCLDAAQKGEAGPFAETADLLKDRVFLPQNLAFMLTFYFPLTLVGLYLIPLSAPAALWFSIRHWNHKGGFQVRGRWRAYVAIALALMQLLFVGAMVLLIIYGYYRTIEKIQPVGQ